MPQYRLGGHVVTLDIRDQNLFFFRRQGISLHVSPPNVEDIECPITLNGLAASTSAYGACHNCRDLDVWGPKFWGFNVPQAFCQVHVEARIRISGTNYYISGDFLIGNKPCPGPFPQFDTSSATSDQLQSYSST